MKNIKYMMVIIAMIVAIRGNAQVFTPGDFNDGIYVKENSENRKPIPYTSLREGDVQWSKRVWRKVDLREKLNQPLYYPREFTSNRESLVQMLLRCLMTPNPEEKIMAFNDEEFRKPLDLDGLRSMINCPPDEDSSQVDMVDAATGNTYQVWEKNFGDTTWFYDAIESITLKEDWFFDKQKSVMECRIIGIGLNVPKNCKVFKNANYNPSETEPGLWFYFPQLRPLFASKEVYNSKNDSERRTFDDIFWKRQFASNIIRESNVYDREIQSYSKGIDALLENERVKNDIFKYEHDMWHF